jgi:hypothetical protein
MVRSEDKFILKKQGSFQQKMYQLVSNKQGIQLLDNYFTIKLPEEAKT